MTSEEASKKYLEYFDNGLEIDFLFIDGLHEKCNEDIDLWLRFVKKDGLIAFHDYDIDHLEVMQPVNSSIASGKMQMLSAKSYMCICKKL